MLFAIAANFYLWVAPGLISEGQQLIADSSLWMVFVALSMSTFPTECVTEKYVTMVNKHLRTCFCARGAHAAPFNIVYRNEETLEYLIYNFRCVIEVFKHYM